LLSPTGKVSASTATVEASPAICAATGTAVF
jgi:hypothetical protein